MEFIPNVDENLEWPIVVKKLNGNRDTIKERHIVDSRVKNQNNPLLLQSILSSRISPTATMYAETEQYHVKFNNIFSSNHGAYFFT